MNNKPGVLVRVALVFARRGYNIESLVVSPTVARRLLAHDDHLLRATRRRSSRSSSSSRKLIDVVHAIDHTGDDCVRDRDRAGEARVRSSTERTEILQIAEHYSAKVVDYGADSLMLRVYGDSEKLDAFIALLRPYGLSELVRSRQDPDGARAGGDLSSGAAKPVGLDELRRYAVARSLFAPTTLQRAIDTLGFVQADPIRAPARAQDLTLRHRVADYRAGDLERRYATLGDRGGLLRQLRLPAARRARR